MNKFIKITFIVFISTLALSLVKANAANTWIFAGVTITGRNTTYRSSIRQKNGTGNQKFVLSTCNDTLFWLNRNLKVQVENTDTSATSAIKEVSPGSSKIYDEAGLRSFSKYRLRMKIANPLVNEVYFNATWYLDL